MRVTLLGEQTQTRMKSLESVRVCVCSPVVVRHR